MKGLHILEILQKGIMLDLLAILSFFNTRRRVLNVKTVKWRPCIWIQDLVRIRLLCAKNWSLLGKALHHFSCLVYKIYTSLPLSLSAGMNLVKGSRLMMTPMAAATRARAHSTLTVAFILIYLVKKKETKKTSTKCWIEVDVNRQNPRQRLVSESLRPLEFICSEPLLQLHIWYFWSISFVLCCYFRYITIDLLKTRWETSQFNSFTW